jgi:hypothetical protein
MGEEAVESSSLLYPQTKSRETLMDEQRKYAILFAATILAARKLIEMKPDKPNMAKGYVVDKAIVDAAFILERIDARWPTIVNSFSAKEP